MYEQVSHSLLNDILSELDPEIQGEELRYFYTRLGANFYPIYSLFTILYGKRDDFRSQIQALVETMARQYVQRPDYLRQSDLEREKNHNWFLSQEWVGMALYADGFARDLPDLIQRVNYFPELGVNMVHLMPMMQCPQGASDGGYAISDFRQIARHFGKMEDLQELTGELRKRNILLTLDVVLNHTSDEHQWAQQAREGDSRYQDYYYIFDNREVPDMFEVSMPEIFPETAPGNFTWDEAMGKWVMTVFNSYQWDLNYSNPAVFIEMVDIVLYWATPLEMLVSNGGDCEDFATAKYFTLRQLDIPDEKLRLVYVKSLKLKQPHMVLSYYAEPTTAPLILDNLIRTILFASQRTDLIPVYSFNAQGLWLTKEERSERLGGAERLSLWQALQSRFNQEVLAAPLSKQTAF